MASPENETRNWHPIGTRQGRGRIAASIAVAAVVLRWRRGAPVGARGERGTGENATRHQARTCETAPGSDGGAFPCVGELAPLRSRGAAGLVTASRRGSDGAGGDRRASGRRTLRRARPSWVRRRREPRSRDWRASNCLSSRRHFRTGGYFSKPRIYAPKRGRCSRTMLELVGAISAIFSGPFAACRHAEVSAVSAALCSPLYKITSSLG